MKKLLLLFILFALRLHAERGIVIPCNDKYFHYTLPSIAQLVFTLKTTLPIEVWHAGEELSIENIAILEKIPGVTVRDLKDVLGDFAYQCRGWQIKPEVIAATNFTDVLLVDADAYFFRDPAFLFDHPEYFKKGVILFRDRIAFTYPFPPQLGNPSYSIDRYIKQRDFITGLVPKPSPYVLEEWRHYWQGNLPSIQDPVPSGEVESGCVVFNKITHKRGLEAIVDLNRNWRVTYEYVYGDKDTFWIGLEIAREPYYVEPTPSYHLHPNAHQSRLSSKIWRLGLDVVDQTHLFDGKLLWSQKDVFYPKGNAILVTDFTEFVRELTEEEKNLVIQAYWTMTYWTKFFDKDLCLEK